jgi:hypothetical protein
LERTAENRSSKRQGFGAFRPGVDLSHRTARTSSSTFSLNRSFLKIVVAAGFDINLEKRWNSVSLRACTRVTGFPMIFVPEFS